MTRIVVIIIIIISRTVDVNSIKACFVSPLDVSKHLCVAQELSKVDVEHVTTGLQHNVIIVAVTYSQNVGGHAAAGTGVDEVLHCLDTRHSYLSETVIVCVCVCACVTLSYCSSLGLCFNNHSANGRSLKEPVTPCSTWIFLRVSA